MPYLEQRNGFNPAEAEEGFSSLFSDACMMNNKGFNPAEAEEGFSSRRLFTYHVMNILVSIQPKPKKGLVV